MNTLEISKNKLQEIRKAEEYFNALATNIQLSGVDLKVIAISSVQENEGKSTTSTNLAVALRVRVTRPSWSTVISGTLS